MKFLSRLLSRTPKPTDGPHRDPGAHIAKALSAAGLDRDGAGADVRGTIDRALKAAGLLHGDRPLEPAAAHGRRRDAAPPSPNSGALPTPAVGGQFLHATYANEHGRRDYRLYLPEGYRADGPARPLIVMLHGCTQSAEDFATGTRMNVLADRHGFLVAYPQQIGRANHAKCWNWFRPEDQSGDAGEPSILAGMMRQIAQDHRVDRSRMFVAGLSAGAAMAVILGRTHPDLVRAVGVHSGLPYASAHDVPSAFAAMQGRGAARDASSGGPRVPMILFHGDADRTVAISNADALAASMATHAQHSMREDGRSPGGQTYTREVVTDATTGPRLERWTVHGAGHAWSGGDPAGSYTEPVGPDASAAMVAFFLGVSEGASDPQE